MRRFDLSRREFLGGAAATVSMALLPGGAVAHRIFDVGSERAIAGEDPMDRDLLEVTIPKLHALYDARKYTTTQVTRWYLERIGRYDGTYRALLHVDAEGALRRAAEEDAEAAGVKNSKGVKRGELWRKPIKPENCVALVFQTLKRLILIIFLITALCNQWSIRY